jgi:uncharacterized membrane protein YjjP (DUF1212 family)
MTTNGPQMTRVESKDERGPSSRPNFTLPASEALDLLIRAATLLFDNGQTTERTTKSVEDLASTLGFRATVSLHWGDLRILCSNGTPSPSVTVAANPLGVDMGKVTAVMRAIAEARAGVVAPAALRSRLRAIEEMAPASNARFALMAAAGAAALGVIFGANDVPSVLLIALSAGGGACLRRWLAARSSNPFLQPFCAALFAGIFGAIVASLHLGAMQRLVAVCPCMVLVPGPHLLNGTIDLLRARIALGTARVIYASVIILAICTGLLMGLSLGGVTLPASAPSARTPLGYDVISAGVAVAAYGTFFSMPWRLLPIPVAIGMLAHAARWVVISLAGASVEMGALVACFIVGTIVTPLAHRLRLPFAAFSFACVVSLIPGVLLFQMAGGVVDIVALGAKAPSSLMLSVIGDGASAFMIMMAITIGLILPKMLIEYCRPSIL